MGNTEIEKAFYADFFSEVKFNYGIPEALTLYANSLY